MNPSKLLAVVASAFVSMAFVMAIIYYRFQPRWIATYVAVVLLYAALYYRRRRSTDDLPERFRRRLEKAAVTLVLFLTGLFFYSFAPGMPWWVAGAAWLGLAAAGYHLYEVIIIFDDDEEEEAPPASAALERV